MFMKIKYNFFWIRYLLIHITYLIKNIAHVTLILFGSKYT